MTALVNDDASYTLPGTLSLFSPSLWGVQTGEIADRGRGVDSPARIAYALSARVSCMTLRCLLAYSERTPWQRIGAARRPRAGVCPAHPLLRGH